MTADSAVADRRAVAAPDGERRRDPLPRRRARRRAAGPAAARVPGVLVVLAPPARAARRRPATARWPSTCADTAGATSRRAGTTWSPSPATSPASYARSASRNATDRRPRLGRPARLDDRRLPPQGRTAPGRGLRGAPAAVRARDADRPTRARVGGAAHLGLQLPIGPEKRLLRDDAARVGELLRDWSGPGWPDPRSEQVYRSAFQIPGVAHCALEYYRWAVRSMLRPDGLRYARRMRSPIRVPVLHLHGALDRYVLPRSAQGSGRYVEAPYRWKLIEGAGHFPHEERAELFDGSSSAGSPTPSPTAEGGRHARPRRRRTGTQRPATRRVRPAAAARRGGRRTRPRRLLGPAGRGARRGAAPARRRPALPRPRGARGRVEVRARGGARPVAGPRTARRGLHAPTPGQRPRRTARC